MKLKSIVTIIVTAAVGFSTTGCSWHEHHEKAHYAPGLGEIMSLTSMRHAKLWFAGQGRNWVLADYELEELREGFEDAVKFHPTHKDIKEPIAQLIAKTMDDSMSQLEKAIKAKNQDLFTQHFDSVTAGCNACHQVSEFGFNIVTRPTFNPFANQAFSTSTK